MSHTIKKIQFWRNFCPFHNSITCVLLRIAQHYVLQQRHFAATFGVHGVGHQVEVRGWQEVGHGDPEDWQIGWHAGRIHPEITGHHLVSLQPELLVQPAVVSWHALDLQDLRALIERRLDGAIVQGIRFHCSQTPFLTLNFSFNWKRYFYLELWRIFILIRLPGKWEKYELTCRIYLEREDVATVFDFLQHLSRIQKGYGTDSSKLWWNVVRCISQKMNDKTNIFEFYDVRRV